MTQSDQIRRDRERELSVLPAWARRRIERAEGDAAEYVGEIGRLNREINDLRRVSAGRRVRVLRGILRGWEGRILEAGRDGFVDVRFDDDGNRSSGVDETFPMTDLIPVREVALAQHVLAMADDSYLTGHPEWIEIVAEAKALS